MTPQELYDLRCDPTYDELKNAFNGYVKKEQRRIEAMRNIAYGAARWQASQTAWSTKQSSAISRYKFPWEKASKKEPMSGKQVSALLSFISKPEKKN